MNRGLCTLANNIVSLVKVVPALVVPITHYLMMSHTHTPLFAM